MPWVRLDDHLHLNRKIAGLTSDAFRLWALSITWSSKAGKDGNIPPDALPFIWPTALQTSIVWRPADWIDGTIGKALT